jgi:hypothetical protein
MDANTTLYKALNVFGHATNPHGILGGPLTAKSRWLLSAGVRMGTVDGNTGKVHGPATALATATALGIRAIDEGAARLALIVRAVRDAEAASVTPDEIRAMRAWIADCEWADLDVDSLAELTDECVIRGIRQHYEGGIAQFRADGLASDETPICGRCGGTYPIETRS